MFLFQPWVHASKPELNRLNRWYKKIKNKKQILKRVFFFNIKKIKLDLLRFPYTKLIDAFFYLSIKNIYMNNLKKL